MAVNNFDVLKRMAAENKDIRLGGKKAKRTKAALKKECIS